MNTSSLSAEQHAVRRRLARIAKLMDSSIRVPVIGKRIGWDAVIGLIPGIGDVVGAAISLYIVVSARQLELRRRDIARMLGNIGLETLLGAVPVLGDLFDMAFRANERNIAVIDRHMARTGADDTTPGARSGADTGGSKLVLFLLGIGSVVAAGAIASRLLASTV